MEVARRGSIQERIMRMIAKREKRPQPKRVITFGPAVARRSRPIVVALFAGCPQQTAAKHRRRPKDTETMMANEK
jgi:hypothetical protein